MKLTVLAFFIGMMGVSASTYSQKTKISLDLTDVSISQLFKTIESQSEFVFIYENEALKTDKKISISVTKAGVEKILSEVLKDSGLEFEIIDKQVVITKGSAKESTSKAELESLLQQLQKKEIKGRVTDSKGVGLPGVSVMAKKTTIGVITDIDGKYTLNVPTEVRTLTFSFVGMVSQEITIGSQSNINIVMQEAVIEQSEVVVVGYGAQKKASVVGSIAAVSSKDLMKRGGVYNLSSAISGQMAGVTVMEMSGEPGRNDPQILIRGMSTWNGSQPLILVDGIERRMTDIDINEVDNISVLKDASATAVYGVKGANGVILITTKRGEVGKAKLSMSANTGFESVSRINGLMDAYEAQSWRNAAVVREVSANEASWAYYKPYEQLMRSKRPQVEPYSYLYPNVDWKKEMFNDYARSSRVNMNISGGTDFAQYFASVGYIHEGDLLKSHYNTVKNYDPGYSYDRFNFRGNIDFKLTKTTTLSTNLSGYFGTKKSPNATFGGTPGQTGHIFRGYYELAPDAFPVFYPDGNYGKDPANLNMNNPIAILQEGGVAVANRRSIATDVKLVQKLDFITRGLSVSANVSYDQFILTDGPTINDNGNQGQALYTYINPAILDAKTRQDTLNNYFYYATAGLGGKNDYDWAMVPWTTNAEAVANGSLERSLFYQAAINYGRQFGKHDVSGLFLVNRRENNTGSGFPNFREDWVGRATYAYNSKYFVEFNGAYNGSEKFSKKYRFGFFPSMALGWMVSNEEYMKKYTWLDKLKLRGSIGQIGSDAGIPRWGYVAGWSQGVSPQPAILSYGADGTIVNSPYTSYREGTIANPNIHWETAIKRNIGAEISVFNRLITVDVDVFNDKRTGIFMTSDRRNIANYFGAAAVASNLGETESKGYEILLGFNKSWNDVGVWAKLGISRATDKITKSEDPPLYPTYQKLVGFPIAQTRTQVRADFMNNWDEVYGSAPATANMIQRAPGDWDIIDYNADGIINTYDNIPNSYTQRPQNTYSTTLGGNWKNFSFMVQFYGVSNITLSPYVFTPGLTRWVPVSEELRDYWRPDNTDAHYKAPRLATTSAAGDWSSQDASFLRLKTAEVAYTMPPKVSKFLGLSNCRVFVNGNNLILWSDFPADFETGSVDIQNAYPTYKLINLGVDIQF